MSELKYIPLYDLIELNPDKLEIIKQQYLWLLSNLTVTEYIESSLFIKNINKICEMGVIVIGIVTDNMNNFEIVASGTIIIEPKIIRKGKNVGHIEDIVVAPHMRGKGISRYILELLTHFAKDSNCYKITLDCSEELKNVYNNNGFNIKGIQMVKYFN